MEMPYVVKLRSNLMELPKRTLQQAQQSTSQMGDRYKLHGLKKETKQS